MMGEVVITPNFDWYATLSRQLGGAPRCPYLSSLSLMGSAGATKMDKAEEERLFARWKQSDIWPHTADQDTGTFQTVSDSGATQTSMFLNFCPEVTFDIFGLFASALGNYTDEMDRDFAHRRLQREDVPSNDWRWSWSFVTPMHYSQCPLYSLLSSKGEPREAMDDSKQDLFEETASEHC